MNYVALATDYDGTIAFDGRVDEPTLAALREAKAAGLQLIMVTGRQLPDLLATFPETPLFDCVVAENGALLYDPGTEATELLTTAPPQALIDALAVHAVPIAIGHCIVATVEPYDQQVFDAIRNLGLEWHVIFNKGSVMALPADVTKATGLTHALQRRGIAPEQVVGVGDAENDQAFLRMCGLSVAVNNALPIVKEQAHVVTKGDRGAGVTELIAGLLSGELAPEPPKGGPHVHGGPQLRAG